MLPENEGAEVTSDASQFVLPPEADEALEAMLSQWAENRRPPRPELERIRRSVLTSDPAYEPLTPQWWRRVLRETTGVLPATTDVRAYLRPVTLD